MRGNEPDQRKQRNQKDQNTHNPTTKHQNKPKPTTKNKQIRLMSAQDVKKQKVQIRRPNTGVKRGDDFLSSCSQYRTPRTRLHSAYWLAGVPQETQCVSVCMSETESKSEVQIRFFLGPFGAGHDTTCIKECVRAIDHVSNFKLTNSVLRTPHACGTKSQSARVLGLVIAQPGIPVGDQGRSDSGHCSLAAMWSKDPGQARSGRRFRIDA